MLLENVRARLTTLRDEAQISEASIARSTGLFQQEVNRFFTGDMKFPRLDFMDAIARVFHYTLADVLAKDLPPNRLTKQELRILTTLKTMDDDLRKSFEVTIVRGAKPRRSGR